MIPDLETIKLIKDSAIEKTNSAFKNISAKPDEAQFWVGQSQAFAEIERMLTQMENSLNSSHY